MQAIRVTCTTGKEVILRKPKIKDREIATAACESRSGKDKILTASVMMQSEMLKLIILQIDKQKPDRAKIEDLDNYFEMSEFNELMSVMEELLGKRDSKPKMEITTI